MSYLALLTVIGFLWLGICTFGLVYLVRDRKKGFDPRVIGQMKRLAEVEIQLADLHDLYERLMTSHKRLRSSAGMAKLRGIKSEEESNDLKHASEAEILRRMNVNRRPA